MDKTISVGTSVRYKGGFGTWYIVTAIKNDQYVVKARDFASFEAYADRSDLLTEEEIFSVRP